MPEKHYCWNQQSESAAESAALLAKPQCNTGDFHQTLTSKANAQAKNHQGFFFKTYPQNKKEDKEYDHWESD